MEILENMLKRLTSPYNKNADSNIAKLFSVVTGEYEELKRTFENVRRYRDIDQAKGASLDRFGGNVNEARGNKNDIDYRKFIKTRIKSNLSPGDIETINDIATVLIGDAFIGIKETWNQSSYAYEDAAIVLLNKGLGEIIKIEYEQWLNDLIYLNGAIFLDGATTLNGGINFDYEKTKAERNKTIVATKKALKRVVAGGVKVYYEVPEAITNEVRATQNVTNIQINRAIHEIGILQSVTKNTVQRVTASAINRLDGIHFLDGSAWLDGHRDFTVHDVSIMEVTA